MKIREELKILEKNILNCSFACKKSNNARLFGRNLTDEYSSIDVLFLGMAPQPETYNSKEKRIIFGPYSPTGKRIKNLLFELQTIFNNLSCWGTNCVKCNVAEDEIPVAITRCATNLKNEIEILRPKAIILFGKTVVENFLKEKFSVGRVSSWQEVACMHYYHPMERTGRFMKHKGIVFDFLKTVYR